MKWLFLNYVAFEYVKITHKKGVSVFDDLPLSLSAAALAVLTFREIGSFSFRLSMYFPGNIHGYESHASLLSAASVGWWTIKRVMSTKLRLILGFHFLLFENMRPIAKLNGACWLELNDASIALLAFSNCETLVFQLVEVLTIISLKQIKEEILYLIHSDTCECANRFLQFYATKLLAVSKRLITKIFKQKAENF